MTNALRVFTPGVKEYVQKILISNTTLGLLCALFHQWLPKFASSQLHIRIVTSGTRDLCVYLSLLLLCLQKVFRNHLGSWTISVVYRFFFSLLERWFFVKQESLLCRGNEVRAILIRAGWPPHHSPSSSVQASVPHPPGPRIKDHALKTTDTSDLYKSF